MCVILMLGSMYMYGELSELTAHIPPQIFIDPIIG